MRTLHECAVVVVALACGAPALASTIVTDPSDDSSIQDIVAISAGYDATALYLTADFRSGTFDAGNLGFIFGLDTDLDSLTGCQPPSFFPVGADYAIGFNSSADPVQAGVYRFSDVSLMGTIAVSFAGDSLSFTVPLTLLGGSDGLCRFGFMAGTPTGLESFNPGDACPDDGFTGQALHELSSPVPEPATLALVTLGGLAVMRRRPR